MSPTANHQYEPEERLQLDWAEFPLAKDVLYKLKALLTQGDASGEILWEVASSRSPNLVQLLDIGPNPLVVRFSKQMKRKMNGKTMSWFVKLTILIEYIAQWIGSGEHVKFRQAQYAKQLSMTPGQLQKMLCDIAVTIKLHPWSLGLEPENDGRIFLPEGIILKVFTTPNLWETARAIQEQGNPKEKSERIRIARRSACITGRIKNEQAVPTKVIDIELTKGDIKAVIVMEHRNVGTRLKWFEKNSKHMILVMTQGYSSLSTRAFLHALHRALPLGTKFFFFCDHDPQGSQIFTNIKYGAKASAWATDLLTVPSIEYLGPTKKQVLDDQKARFVEGGLFRWSKKEAYIRKKMQVKVTKNDEAILRGLRDLGIMDLEPALGAEMEELLCGEGKFSLSLLSDGHPTAMEEFIVSQANSRIGVTTTSNTINAKLYSQDTMAFNRRESSNTDMTQSPIRMNATVLSNIRKPTGRANRFNAPNQSSA